MMTEIHEMMNTLNVIPMPGDPDHHFARMMKMHHEYAINMATIVLQEGSNETIRNMARQIIQKQQQDITVLENFLASHIAGTANYEFNVQMDNCTDAIDSSTWNLEINGNIDHDFAMLMITHHQHAIEMANIIIHYSHNETIQRLAREIREDNEIEIAAFQSWLAAA